MIVFEGSAPVTLPLQTSPNTLQQIFQDWGEEWIWDNLQKPDDDQWLAQAISKGTAVLVCDGSYQPRLNKKRGGAAWIIECNVSDKRMIGFLASTSTASSAYRSELTGIYAGLAMTLAVTTLHNIKNDSLQVHCDNERCILLSAVTTMING